MPAVFSGSLLPFLADCVDGFIVKSPKGNAFGFAFPVIGSDWARRAVSGLAFLRCGSAQGRIARLGSRHTPGRCREPGGGLHMRFQRVAVSGSRKVFSGYLKPCGGHGGKRKRALPFESGAIRPVRPAIAPAAAAIRRRFCGRARWRFSGGSGHRRRWRARPSRGSRGRRGCSAPRGRAGGRPF